MSLVGLHTALSGIRAARVGMDVTSHNVANANTEGYTRQHVDLATGYPSQTAVGKIGTGVTVAEISRLRDAFLDQRVRSDMATGGQLDVTADLLSRSEAVFGEPDNGLTTELNEIWAAFEELSLRPDDRATRRQAVSALESFAARVKSIAGGLDTLEKDTTLRLEQSVADVNRMLQQVADLNGDILEAKTGPGVPNDLLDQRDALLDQLTTTVGARVSMAEDGTARVSLAGMEVVRGTNPQTLSLYEGTDPSQAHQVLHELGSPVTVGGEIAGLQGFLQDQLPTLVEDLDGFLVQVRDQLNGQHGDGFEFSSGAPPGVEGVELIDYAPQTTATAIQDGFALVMRDPDRLAASGDQQAELDGSNAALLAGLRTTSPIDGSIRTIVTDLAAQVQSAERRASGQRDLTSASQAAREGMHGVSLDEEMVSMLSHQRALEASSRVMSAVDQALDVLINRTGIVGR